MSHSATTFDKEIRSIRTSFRRLARSFGRITPNLTAVPDAASSVSQDETKETRRSPRMTTAYGWMLKLQGKYMGTMRGLRPAQRVKVKKIRAAKGISAAIAQVH